MSSSGRTDGGLPQPQDFPEDRWRDGLRIRVESPVPVEIVSRDGTVQCHPAGVIGTTITERR